MRIMVTGGAGYIGSHTVLQLLQDQHEVLVYDNLSNSVAESLNRVARLAGRQAELVEADIQDAAALERSFQAFNPEAVVHFAGLKAVGESTQIPLEYYAQNVNGSIELLRAMQRHNCPNLVFSSSATVYGDAQYLPFDEGHPLSATNPYGRTKLFIEDIIRDWAASWDQASAVLLRYFNPVGAHASGEIGEDPTGIPNNLLPYIAQVAVGRRPALQVFGGDYDTRDGTGERDYIHVVDLARAHLAALAYSTGTSGVEAVNIGTGQGTTVLEMISAFAKASGQDIPYNIVPRRDGDVAVSLASVAKARSLLGWQAELSLDDMCASSWNWQSSNPNGYKSQE
jgi:UDP-glucose 4-epimerase